MRYAAFFCLLSAACLSVLYWSVTSEMDTQIDAGLRAEMAALTRLYELKGVDGLTDVVRARSSLPSLAASDTGDSGPRQYLLADPGGRVLAGTFSAWPEKLGAAEGWATLELMLPPDQPGLDQDGPRVRVRLDAASLPGGYRLLVGQALNETDELRGTLLTVILSALLLTIAAGLTGGVLMGRGVVRRLEQVTEAADSIMNGDLARRIREEGGRDEFDRLARKLNVMLARIEELMRQSREVTENVAHDLRSPLTRLRAQLEANLRRAGPGQAEALQKAMDETDRIVATLNAILSIAEIGARSRAAWESLDLEAVCRDAAELYAPLAEQKGVGLGLELKTGVRMAGNRQLLAQAVSNLLDNAIKYTPPGGRVSLSLAADGPEARLTVADSGPGIPAEMRARVLERFVRLDQSRSLPGNGLGLSLVDAVASHHQAQLYLEDNHPGLRVVLVLPAAQQ